MWEGLGVQGWGCVGKGLRDLAVREGLGFREVEVN